MSTTLYLKQQFNSALAVSAGIGVYQYASLTRSVLALVTALTATATAGSNIQMTQTSGGTLVAWISPPVAHPITVSGTVTFNLWAKMNLLSANTTVAVSLCKYTGGVQGTAFLTSSFGTAIGTTITNANWTGSPTSTTFAIGDRLVILCLITNATSLVMVAGDTCTMDYAGVTASADGDGWVQLTETVLFQSEPEMIQEIEGSSPQTFAGVTTAGNLIVFNCEAQSSAGVTMSDGQSDTFVNECNVTWAAGTNFNTFGFAASIAGGSTTLTATNSDYMWAVEYGGMAAAPYDTGDTVGATGTGSSSAVASNAVTTNYANELIVGMFDIGDGTATPGASFINRSGQGGALMDFSVTATGTYQATGTQNGNDGWAATVLTFKWGPGLEGHFQLESGTGNIELESGTGDLALEQFS